jgi:hypothetical protein
VSLQGTKQFIDLPFQRPVHLTGTLEILPPNAPEIVRQVYDTALTDQLRSAIAVTTSNRPTRIRRSKPGTIFVNVTMQAPLPIDCAFEVFARIGDREVALGEFSGSKAQTSGTKTRSIRREHSSFDAETFVPVLRSSVEVAKKTTDMFEIWGGELVLDPVAIVLPLPEPVQSLDD